MPDDINKPEIVAEVRDAFERYNQALDVNDVAALNGFFWQSPHTVRFGIGEHLYGYDEIAQYRSGQWTPGAPRRLVRVAITTLGRDFATTSAVFERGGVLSRQSQTWARRPEGWRIIAAHVSLLKK